MVNLCKILSSRVFVCCGKSHGLETFEFRVWCQRLFRRVFFQLCRWHLYYQQKQFPVPRIANCFQRRSISISSSGQGFDCRFLFCHWSKKRVLFGVTRDSQYFSPVNEVSIDEGSASVVYKRLKKSKKNCPFLNTRCTSLSSNVCTLVYHRETRKCINNPETMKVSITCWVTRSFVVNLVCSQRNSLEFPFFQWYFISVVGLGFVVLARRTTSNECTYPVKHARPVVESLWIIVRFWSAHMSTHFVIISECEKSQEKW